MQTIMSGLVWRPLVHAFLIKTIFVLLAQTSMAQAQQKSVATLIQEMQELAVILSQESTHDASNEAMDRERARLGIKCINEEIGARGLNVLSEIDATVRDTSVDQTIFSCLLLLEANVPAQPTSVRVAELVEEIRKVHETWENQKDLAPDSRTYKTIEDVLGAAEAFASELGCLGEAAIPAIKGAIANEEMPLGARRDLVGSLKNLNEKEVDAYLTELAAQGSPLSENALLVLEAHANRGKLQIELSEAQLDSFSHMILDESVPIARQYAVHMKMFDRTPAEKRYDPLIQRYLLELASDARNIPHPYEKPGNYRDYALNTLLFAIRECGTEIQPLLLKILEKGTCELGAAKWIKVALAATGDVRSAQIAKAIVDDINESPAARSAAVEAYAAALDKAALPDLLRWADDTTVVTSEMHGWKRRPIADSANYWISQLEEVLQIR